MRRALPAWIAIGLLFSTAMVAVASEGESGASDEEPAQVVPWEVHSELAQRVAELEARMTALEEPTEPDSTDDPHPIADPSPGSGDEDAGDGDAVDEDAGDEDADTPPDRGRDSGYLVISESDLAALPTNGAAWDALVAEANQSLSVNLADQDGYDSARAVAAGLVYARTGNDSYRTKVERALDRIPATRFGTTNSVLAVGRHLAGWVIAADLVGYDNPQFNSWLDSVRTDSIGTHGRWQRLTQTHEATANNWGTFAGASRIAASAYLGDTQDLEAAATVFRGWTGDRGAYSGFVATSDFETSWACNYPNWAPINNGCGPRDGALVEDVSRAGPYPNSHADYVGEAFQGATMQALLLDRQGFDAFEWSDGGMCRAGAWIDRNDVSRSWHRINRWTLHTIDAHCDTSYAPGAAGYGRNFGFTDWLGTR